LEKATTHNDLQRANFLLTSAPRGWSSKVLTVLPFVAVAALAAVSRPAKKENARSSRRIA
jgi:hypothetical protein